MQVALTQATMVGLGLAAWSCLAWSQAGIFTCVDSKGRRLTADRPIAECTDREQKELSSTGIVRRTLPPTPTAQEQAIFEEKARKAAEEANRAAEEKRRDRALLARYPNQTVHDKERNIALQVVDDVIVTANKRVQELTAQHQTLVTETDAYKGDVAKIPVRLKRLIEENELQQAAQKRFLAEQAAEKQRINARFDQELARLRSLWALQMVPAAPAAPAAAAARKS